MYILKVRRNVYQTRNLKHISPILAAGIVMIVVILGGVRNVMNSQTLILGTYFIGVIAAAIAWYGKFRWKQTLWTTGMVLSSISMAVMLLTGQFWLLGATFFFLLAVIIYPTIAKQTHEEVRRRREQNRQ
jgi:hypothetical protein